MQYHAACVTRPNRTHLEITREVRRTLKTRGACLWTNPLCYWLRITINQPRLYADQLSSGRARAFNFYWSPWERACLFQYNIQQVRRATATSHADHNLHTTNGVDQRLPLQHRLLTTRAIERRCQSVTSLPWGLSTIWHEFPVTWRFSGADSGLIDRLSWYDVYSMMIAWWWWWWWWTPTSCTAVRCHVIFL